MIKILLTLLLIIMLIRGTLLVVLPLIVLILTSSVVRCMLVPIDNKKIKNRWINLIIICRINYFNILNYKDDFCIDLINKIYSKNDLNNEELNYLNKKI